LQKLEKQKLEPKKYHKALEGMPKETE